MGLWKRAFVCFLVKDSRGTGTRVALHSGIAFVRFLAFGKLYYTASIKAKLLVKKKEK